MKSLNMKSWKMSKSILNNTIRPHPLIEEEWGLFLNYYLGLGVSVELIRVGVIYKEGEM